MHSTRSSLPKRRLAQLAAATFAIVCLTASCGSDAAPPDVSLPGTGSLPERTTTVPDNGSTAPPNTETPSTDTPTTETPTTETPTTETPTTETATTAAPAASTPESTSDDGTPWWPWLLLAAAVIGLIVFLATRGSRRAAAWTQQAGAAFDEATRLATNLAAVSAEGAAMVAAQDAAQLASLASTLAALSSEAPDDARQRAVASVRDQVQVLHGVVDGIAMGAGPASPAALDYLKEQAAALHGATALARAEVSGRD